MAPGNGRFWVLSAVRSYLAGLMVIAIALAFASVGPAGAVTSARHEGVVLVVAWNCRLVRPPKEALLAISIICAFSETFTALRLVSTWTISAAEPADDSAAQVLLSGLATRDRDTIQPLGTVTWQPSLV